MTENFEAGLNEAKEAVAKLRDAIGQVVVGQNEVVDQVMWALVAGGHVLLEGAPGLGKTLLVRTLSQCLELKFSRIQFTPDLMPSDVIGTNVLVMDPAQRAAGSMFAVQKGPIFGQIVLADEINRATPKTQSSLLEAMAEHAVTIAGTRHALDEPFFVLATENPIEMEGTYPAPRSAARSLFAEGDRSESERGRFGRGSRAHHRKSDGSSAESFGPRRRSSVCENFVATWRSPSPSRAMQRGSFARVMRPMPTRPRW